ETLDDRAQQLAVDAFEPLLVDLVQLERLARDLNRHDALVSNLGDVAHAPQDAVGDTRSPARAARDFGRRDIRDLDAEDPRVAEDVALLEPREDRSHVAFTLARGSGNSANANGELVAQDVREARLAESRWAGEEDVVERLAAVLGRLERDRQLLLDAFLAHEV